MTAWVSGTSENRYYFVNEVEINGDSSVVSTEAPTEEETTVVPTEEETTLVPAEGGNIFYTLI